LYSATLLEKSGTTELNIGVNFGIRGAGSSSSQFDTRRYQASGDYLTLKGDISQTYNFSNNFQLCAKLQGQLSDQALIDSEQISGGGLSTVRGYLESEVVGDNGAFASFEIRSPNIFKSVNANKNDWRLYAFYDAGAVVAIDALPEQAWRFALASYGIGSHLKFDEHFNGSIDVAMPLINRSPTKANEPRLTFRIWSDF